LLISQWSWSSCILTLVLISCPLMYRSASGQTINTNFTMYEDPNLGIKIQYPLNWTIERHGIDSTNVMFLAPGSPLKYAEKLFIDILDENRSLTDVADDVINFDKYKNDAITDYHNIESIPTVVNNMPAYKIVDTYNSKDKFGNVKSMDVYVLKRTTMYELLFTSEPEKFDLLLPTVQKMINSFQITK
jgi:PsbP-like protein